MIGIYSIKNIITNKYYIGSAAISFEKRFIVHKSQLNNNKHPNNHLQDSWNKYGKNAFTFQIEEIVEDKNKLIEKEDEWLEACWPLGLYNECPFAYSSIGRKHTEESKQKISLFHKGNKYCLGRRLSKETKRKISKNNIGFKGRKHTEETKQKISKSETGKIVSEETKQKISISISGSNHPMFGKKHSNKTKKLMSIVRIGKKRSPFSEKWKNNMSIAQKKRQERERKTKL